MTCAQQSEALDNVACQHLLVRNARRVLQPWYDDASTCSAEKGDLVHTAADLLLKSSTGSVCGLSFVEGLAPNIPKTVRSSLNRVFSPKGDAHFDRPC